jgi:hypothetical protein
MTGGICGYENILIKREQRLIWFALIVNKG